MAFEQTRDIDGNATGQCSGTLVVTTDTVASVQLTIQTGAIGTCVLTVEGSIDGIIWVATGTTISTETVTAAITVTQYRFIRARVSTASGGALMLTVSLLSKKT